MALAWRLVPPGVGLIPETPKPRGMREASRELNQSRRNRGCEYDFPISWRAGSVLSAITRPSGANYPTTKEPEHVRPSPDLPAMRSTVHGAAIRRSLLLALVSTAL